MDTITFEQPFNEAIRICLRLEQLEKKFRCCLEKDSHISAKKAMEILLETLKLADRPDLKSKLTQLLAQYNAMLSQLHNTPGVDSIQLSELKQQINEHSRILHSTLGRFGEDLRQNDFIYGMALQVSAPGGLCDYSAPDYQLWLRNTDEYKKDHLLAWYEVFHLLNETSRFILHIVRNSGSPKTVQAEDGFYQQSLELSRPCQMIRITLPIIFGIYPEISLGRHRFFVHFLTPNYLAGKRPNPFTKKLEFELTCCQF